MTVQTLYYRLPQAVRRSVYRVTSPGAYARLMKERSGADGRFRKYVERRAIFVHIPKCAGTAVARAVFGQDKFAHRSVAEYQVIFSPEEFAAFYKFTVVRNPWDRLVSAWHFLSSGQGTDADRRWSEQHLGRFRDFADFVMNGLGRPALLRRHHLRPQHTYVCLPGSDRMLVDQVCRTEKLQEGVDVVCRALGLPKVEVPRINTSKHKDYREYYDDRTRARVGEVYATDVRLFGYSFG